MPHRLLGHPIQAVVAVAGFLTSFLASLSATVGSTGHRTQALFAAVDNTTVLSWAGTGVTVLAMVSPGIYKFLKGLRQASHEQDTAEMDSWGQRIADANAAKGTAEGKLNVALEQLESLKLQMRDMNVENRQLAAELSKQRHRTNNLEQEVSLHKQVAAKTKATAVKAGQMAADSSSQVSSLGQRVEAIEHVVASTSGQDFPSPPPAEPRPE